MASYLETPPFPKPIHHQPYHALLPQLDKNHAETESLATYPQISLLPWTGQNPAAGSSYLWPPADASEPGSPHRSGTPMGGAVQTQGKSITLDPKNFPGTGTGGRRHATQEVMDLRRAPRCFLASSVAQ